MSEENAERCLASAVLLAEKYRGRYTENNTANVVTDVAVPVEEHKLFMKLLLEADWAKSEAPTLADALCLYPGQFGIPEIYPASGESIATARQKAFRAWHEKFGAKFRVKRLVAKTPVK